MPSFSKGSNKRLELSMTNPASSPCCLTSTSPKKVDVQYRAQDLSLRDVGATGRSFGNRALRIAVKGARTNLRTAETLTRVAHCLPTTPQLKLSLQPL